MKQTIFKSFALVAMLMVSLMSWAAIDWSGISYLGDGAGGGAYSNLYKVGAETAEDLPNVVNIQQPGWASKAGIYMSFPAAGITCTHECAVDGAGICLYIDQFTAKETEVTVNYSGGSKTFAVYYENGTTGGGEITSEYCNKLMKAGTNQAALFSWETLADGSIQVTLKEPDGSVDATKTHFRGNGIKLAEMKVGEENASTYFSTGTNLNTNVQTFTLLDPAVKPAIGTQISIGEKTVEYAVVADGNCWPSIAFTYTYGGVCPSVFPVTGVELSKSTRTVETGTTYKLTATILPEYATNKNITWSSDAEGVATVNNGTVTPVAAGTANIIVTTEDGGFKDTCVVTVIEKTSQCYGDLGHFATPANAKMHYEIEYAEGNVTFKITSLTGKPLDYGEVQIGGVGNFGMTADGNGGYTYTRSATAGNSWYFLFLYSDTDMPGNEMTAQAAASTDANARYYIVGDCPPPYKKASEDYTKLTGVSATASSTREDAHPIGHAIDNDENTYWMSQWDQDPQTYTVDLGKECVFNTVTVKFGDHRAGLYDILVSRDGENFSTLATDQAGVNNAESSTSVDLTIARYVRLNLRTRPNGYGYDIKNIKVLFAENSVLTTLAISNAENFFKVGQNYTITVDARDQYNVAIDPGTVTYTVTPSSMGTMIGNVFTPSARGEVSITANVGEIVSNALSKHIVNGDNLALNNAMKNGEEWVGTYYGTLTPALAVNGNDGDVWQGSVTNGNDPTTGQVYDAWFVVDLKAEYEIDLISIHFEGACSDAYRIDFSDDADTWATAYSFAKAMGNNNHTDYITSFSESTARYIRFWSTKASTGWGMKIYEMQVFGSEATSTTKTVGVAVNDASMGTATVKQNNVEVTEAEVGSTVVFNAVANDGYEFLNWTKGGTVVSTDATYEVEIESNISLKANFDKIYTQYCHTAVTSTSGGEKKLYLTLSQVADSFQILYEGSAECQLLSMNNANFTINGVCTNIPYTDPTSGNPVATCGQDVPFTKANGRVIFSTEGYGSAKLVFALSEGKTWKDIYVWTHAIYFNTASGEVGYTAFPDRYEIGWNKSCSDDEAPVLTAPTAEALNATDVRLTLSATDNWEGVVTYTISRTGVEDVTASGASGATVTKDITGLTTGTEYTFSVTAKDAAGNVCAAQECKVTPAGDVTTPSNVTITAMPLSDKMVRLTMYADDNLPGELLYNIAWAGGGLAQTTAERGTQVIYDVAGLTPSTEYVFTLTVRDAANNWSGAVNSTAVTTFDKNLALNQPATAGGDALAIASGNNGNLGDRWASGGGDMAKNWWAVDLGKVYDVKNIRISYENACPTVYTLQSSNDGANWAVIESYNTEPNHSNVGANGWNEYPVEAQARYVKIVATAATFGNAYGISIWEFEAYGTPAIDSIKPVMSTFTATGVSSSSVQLKALATDNFCDSLTYVFSCEGVEKGSVKQANGLDASFIVTGLSMGTQYNFSVVAKDAALNVSDAAQAQAEPVTDTEAPQNVSATAGTITHESIELLLYATDNLGGDITYTISRTGAEDVVATSASGVQKSVVISDLNYDTEYSFSVVAKDGSDNAATAVVCNAKTEKAKYPVTAAPVPTRKAANVISIYSDVYTNKPWGHNENWGQATQLQEKQIGEDNHLYYTNLNWLGWQCGQGAEDVSKMKGLHIDIWADVDGQIGIVPIYGGTGLVTDDTRRKIVNVTGKQWNSFDLNLATDFAGLNLSSIFQFKFDNAQGTIFAIDNLYFFIDPDHVRANQVEGALGTICLPYAVAPSNRKGAGFYRINYTNGSFLHFIEETDTLEAGRAYVFQAEAEDVEIFKADDAAEVNAVVVDEESRGLIGTFENITPGNLTGKYVIANDYKIHICGSGAYLNANRAYIDMTQVPTTPLVINDPADAPVRRQLSFGGVKTNPTELENVNAGMSVDGKMIIDGQLIIIRDGKMYNAQGMKF